MVAPSLPEALIKKQFPQDRTCIDAIVAGMQEKGEIRTRFDRHGRATRLVAGGGDAPFRRTEGDLMSNGTGVDTDALRADLESLSGVDVGFDAGARAAYSTDASNFRQVPLGV